LSKLEAATLRFALFRAGVGTLENEDRDLVESALERLSKNLALPEGLLTAIPAQEP
jgi:hypothetical protein